jgi:hypothetical protein
VLRALALALALANAGYFVWTQGWLDDVIGLRADNQREPERMKRQVRPETVQILSPGAAGSLTAPVLGVAPPAAGPASASSSTSSSSVVGACLEAGPFSATEIDAATTALQAALPPGSWADVKTDKPGAWLLYMGRYGDREMLAKKKDEIGRMKLPFEEVRSPPALDPGISLGRFDERAGAEKALATVALRGVKSARVVELTPVISTHVLRVADADAALVKQLAELKVGTPGKGFGPCAKGVAN